ncbi:hypothetical protein CBR_g39997 [Chara braunii]|uniref:Uncharacterized protein n=1 Tax=Chara braunii TaxID=69332 RepID=A0A388LSQ6_CHABU|nr:hypothetical protein CBR_g39997 [Chara braunii]|eukprot:GBG85354.1 hypothetical protein CBR_g39997 [Chara braunii]
MSDRKEGAWWGNPAGKGKRSRSTAIATAMGGRGLRSIDIQSKSGLTSVGSILESRDSRGTVQKEVEEEKENQRDGVEKEASANGRAEFNVGSRTQVMENARAPAPSPTNWIAIDLGTSSCAVAMVANEKVQVIPNEFGKLSTPSFIAFTDTKRLVGVQAQKQVQRRVENVLFEIKRLIGRDYDSIRREERCCWPFSVARGQSGEARVEVKSELLSRLFSEHDEESTQLFTPEEILGMLLAKMKGCAEAFPDCGALCAAAITVPASYSDRQRSATKLAAEIAGFADVELVSETTAATLSYAHQSGMMSLDGGRGCDGESGDGGKTILVFALGGGSFDAALVKIGAGLLNVIAVAGDPSLGGMEFDGKIIELITGGEGRELCEGMKPSMVRKLRVASEKAKRDLTLLRDAHVEIESFHGVDDDLQVQIERDAFEHKCQFLMDKCLNCVEQVLRDSGGTKVEDVNEVLLVGGSTRIPMIARRLREFFGNRLAPRSHPYQDEAVVRGAALWTAFKDRVVDRSRKVGGVDEGSASTMVSAGESARWSADNVIFCRRRSMKVSEYEMKMTGISSERHRWEKFVIEFERRRHTCPPWLDSILSTWQRDTEQGFQAAAAAAAAAKLRGEEDAMTARFLKFREACAYAFGRVWVKSTTSRKPFVGDVWDADDMQLCLQNLGEVTGRGQSGTASEGGHQRSLDLRAPCDLVVCPRAEDLVDLVGLRDRIAQVREGGVELAAPCLGSSFTPEALRESGIAYVLLDTETPTSVSSWRQSFSRDRRDFSSRENNGSVGQRVALVVQSGLLPVVCIGGGSTADTRRAGKSTSLEQRERENCKTQLMDVIRHACSDWRNIVIAYRPISIPICGSASSAVGRGGGGAGDGVFLEGVENNVVETVRYFRQVISHEVSADAAAGTRIVIRGRLDGSAWDALFKWEEIDGFLLEGGFRDPDIVERIREPCRERNDKICLCRTQNGGLPDGGLPSWLHLLTQQLLNAERQRRFFLIAVKHLPNQHLKGSFPLVTSVYERDSMSAARWSTTSRKGDAMFEAKIIPIFGDGQECSVTLEAQLSELRPVINETIRQKERLVLEYKPAFHQLQGVESAHARMRRWIWSNVSPQAAQLVHILCFVDDKVDDATRQAIADLPNVDGLSWLSSADGLSWQLPIRDEPAVRSERRHRGLFLSDRRHRHLLVWVSILLLVAVLLYFLFVGLCDYYHCTPADPVMYVGGDWTSTSQGKTGNPFTYVGEKL